MDWLESWVGISPDNGDGSLELMMLFVAAVGLAVVAIGAHAPTRSAIARCLFLSWRDSRATSKR